MQSALLPSRTWSARHEREVVVFPRVQCIGLMVLLKLFDCSDSLRLCIYTGYGRNVDPSRTKTCLIFKFLLKQEVSDLHT